MLPKLSYYQPGMIAMVGMPFIFLFYTYLDFTKNPRAIEVRYPNEYIIDFVGHYKKIDSLKIWNFITIQHTKNLIENEKQRSFVRNTFINLKKNIKYLNSTEGFHFILDSNATYADLVFIYNMQMIHELPLFEENNNDYYLFFNKSIKGEYFKYGSRPIIKRLNYIWKDKRIPIDYLTQFYTNLKFQINYWHFWILYLILVFTYFHNRNKNKPIVS